MPVSSGFVLFSGFATSPASAGVAGFGDSLTAFVGSSYSFGPERANEGVSLTLILSVAFLGSKRLKSAVALGFDVPPRIVSRATCVEADDLGARGHDPYQLRVLWAWCPVSVGGCVVGRPNWIKRVRMYLFRPLDGSLCAITAHSWRRGSRGRLVSSWRAGAWDRGRLLCNGSLGLQFQRRLHRRWRERCTRFGGRVGLHAFAGSHGAGRACEQESSALQFWSSGVDARSVSCVTAVALTCVVGCR